MSRLDPRVLAAAFLFAASPLRAATNVSGAGPGDSQIHLAGPINVPSGMGLAAAEATGLAEGYRLVARAPGVWLGLALDHDSTLTWPARVAVAVQCDGRWVQSIGLYAMSPPLEQRVMPLGGGYALEVDPSRLWRKRFRKGNVATVLFARFPVDSCRGEVDSLRVVWPAKP